MERQARKPEFALIPVVSPGSEWEAGQISAGQIKKQGATRLPR